MSASLLDELKKVIAAPSIPESEFFCTCHLLLPTTVPPPDLPCPCEREHQRAISSLKGDLNLAARAGSDLLEQLHVMEKRLESQEADYTRRVSELADANALLSAANKELAERATIMADELGKTEATIDDLNTRIAEATARASRLTSYCEMAQSLEAQVQLLESVQEELQNELTSSNRDKAAYERRWRATERMVDQVTRAYQKLSLSAANVHADALLTSPGSPHPPRRLADDLDTSTPIRQPRLLRLSSTNLRPQVAMTPDQSFASPSATDTPASEISGNYTQEEADITNFTDISYDNVPFKFNDASILQAPKARKARSFESFLAPEAPAPEWHAIGSKQAPQSTVQGFTAEVGAVFGQKSSTAAGNMRDLLRANLAQPSPARRGESKGWLSFRR